MTMLNKRVFEPQQLRYLQLLSKQYPTVQAASTEIIRLQSILNLPKGTEHFMSDIHGEYDAFLHILNSCSGEVKEKLKEIFGNSLSQRDRNDLATLIYYPKGKLELVADTEEDMEEWYRITIHRLIQVCRYVSIKHTRNHVREQTPAGFTINFARETRLGDVIELFTSVTPEGKTIVSGSIDGETVFSALV